MQDRTTATLVLELIPSIVSIIRTEMRAAARPDLTVAQFRTISRLGKQPSTNSELAEWMGVQPPTMTRTVESLVAMGFVEREKDAVDRRKVTLALTPEGRTTLKAIQEAFVAKLSGALAELADDEVGTIARGLALLAERVQSLKDRQQVPRLRSEGKDRLRG